jgi:hypothetical protein
MPTKPIAVDVLFSNRDFTVRLADGRRVIVPLTWYPRLLKASRAERAKWRVLGDGYAIEWPDLDEHIGVESLLAGHASGESVKSLKAWLASRRKQKTAGSRKRSSKETA